MIYMKEILRKIEKYQFLKGTTCMSHLQAKKMKKLNSNCI